MIFRVIAKDGLEQLFNLLAADNPVIGPVEIGKGRDGTAIHGFTEVSAFQELSLGYSTTALPAKQHFLPYREELASFSLAGRDWDKRVDYHCDRPYVLFGLHACDINALNKLDKVLLGGVYPMPYYAAKRKNMFIIGIDCHPQPSCFCRSMGSDTALRGFDLFVTDLGASYFVEILSDTAFNLLKKIPTTEPVAADHLRYRQVVDAKNREFTTHVDTTDLTKILDMEFQSEVWKQWGDRCLSCGSCANVCPTCYCYTINEQAALDLRSASKTKVLYSCNYVDFAEVAGGHNFRPHSHNRLKYRYYHKHRGFVEAYEESLCVGCGRCGDSCLAGITVPEVISSVRGGTI
jgi:formate hydrogenlyase subunit 6/NADH:ubiquinone oxidoreductase subunit I